jgi:septum formation protein
MKIILASTSPQKIEILSKSDLQFESHPSLFEEDMTLDMDPYSLAKHLSFGKANSLVSNFPNAVIIGADTFIVHEGKLLGKPHTPEKAFQTLKLLSGKTHSVLTGVSIIETSSKKSHSFVEKKKLKLK